MAYQSLLSTTKVCNDIELSGITSVQKKEILVSGPSHQPDREQTDTIYSDSNTEIHRNKCKELEVGT